MVKARIFSAGDSQGMDNGGFTMVELLVALVIVSLAMGMVTVNWRQSLDSVRLKSGAQTLLSALMRARNAALVGGKETALRLDVREHSVSLSGEHPWSYRGFEGLGLEWKEARTAWEPRLAATVRFFPDGSSSGGAIRLRRGRHTATIEIDWLTGRAALHE